MYMCDTQLKITNDLQQLIPRTMRTDVCKTFEISSTCKFIYNNNHLFVCKPNDKYSKVPSEHKLVEVFPLI